MGKLFIGLKAMGAMGFIGEVERGAECGCRCPMCGSPLVARQGMVNDWHFAHDAATPERPECGGATQHMLRRLVIEHLQSRELADELILPAYRQDVTLTRSLVHLREVAQWGVELVGDLQWEADAGEGEPVARGRLDSGVDLQIFVRQGDAPSAPPKDTGTARLAFQLRAPQPSVYRARVLVEQHIKSSGQLVWEHHPDTLGHVLAARERLEARGYRIYSNWLSMVDAQRHALADASAPAAPLFYGPSSPDSTHAMHRHPGAPLHAPNVNFTFYRLSPQEAWLLYLLEREGPSDWRTAQQKFYALAPYPGPFEGWTQTIPKAVGTADESAGIVRLTGFLDAVTYLSRRARVTRSHRDPRAFDGL